MFLSNNAGSDYLLCFQALDLQFPERGKEIRKCTVLWRLNPIQIQRKKHKTHVK